MKFVCSIYSDRPQTCREYPWNGTNQLFAECIFVDKEKERLRTMEEQLKVNSLKEICDYCVECGQCCFFGPAQCPKLSVIEES
jgi:hypothetical protein